MSQDEMKQMMRAMMKQMMSEMMGEKMGEMRGEGTSNRDGRKGRMDRKKMLGVPAGKDSSRHAARHE